eukprot:TRINITY_DN3006_c0_g1_i1.p1 TRINITY_DN3006_c0_g1~~TRINITY_DN3006_c0_g1_i1.p1  ORF type:complete len:494 (-),score=140.62 TRINITY_DN3006_c0_g1_i1:79-1473(-)
MVESETYPLVRSSANQKYPKRFAKCRKVDKRSHNMTVPFLVAFSEQLVEADLVRDIVKYLEVENSKFGRMQESIGGKKLIKQLRNLHEGSIDLETFWAYLDAEKHHVVSSFNRLKDSLGIEHDDDASFLEKMASVFRVYIEYYTDQESLQVFGSQEDSLMSIYLFDSENSKHALVLYPIGIAEEMDPKAAKVIIAIMDCKLLEAKVLKSIADGERFSSSDNEIKISQAIDNFVALKDKCKLKLDSIEKRMKEWQMLPEDIYSPEKLSALTAELKSVSQAEVQSEQTKVYCLNCSRDHPSEYVHSFRCGHQVCGDCCRDAVKRRERFVMDCPLKTCKYVLNSIELSLINFPKDFVVHHTENCGICGCEVSEVNSRSLHETKEGKHLLCFACLKDYVLQVSDGKVYEYQSGDCKLKGYACPFLRCGKMFGYEVASTGFTEEENVKLFARARKHFLHLHSALSIKSA